MTTTLNKLHEGDKEKGKKRTKGATSGQASKMVPSRERRDTRVEMATSENEVWQKKVATVGPPPLTLDHFKLQVVAGPSVYDITHRYTVQLVLVVARLVSCIDHLVSATPINRSFLRRTHHSRT